MERAFIGWGVAALAALVLASPADARPRTASGDGSATGSTGATATARPAPSPAPAPSSPAPVVTGSRGARPAPAAPTTVRAQSRGERRAPSGGDRATARPRTRGTGSTAATSSEGSSDDDRRAVRRGDRARDGRAAIGRAVPRTRPRPTIPSWAFHRPSYWYGYNSLGLGYFYYDPYYWGYPGHYGYGYYGPRYYGPAYGGYGGGHYVPGDRHLGNVRLKVKPRDAEVRVDGYYVGVVDQYDGIFQRLTLESGPHRIEISMPGFEPLVVDIRVLPYETVTYKGTLEPQ